MAVLAPGAAFGLYALPTDDVAGSGTITNVTNEDPEYPAENLLAPATTGHLNLPSRPAKLTSMSGLWEVTLPSAQTIVAVAVIYHNLDEALNVTITTGGGFSQALTIPAPHLDGWTVSTWAMLSTPQTHAVWRLNINTSNSLPVQVGRLMLLTALRDLGRDVRWGVVEDEEWRNVNDRTELGIDTFYDLGGKERSWVGEFALSNAQANSLIDLHRAAHGRVRPWLLIPDEDIVDPWLVRFEDNSRSRTYEVPDHNIFPFRVRELSRGLPFP
jgi:hypothetical protein